MKSQNHDFSSKVKIFLCREILGNHWNVYLCLYFQDLPKRVYQCTIDGCQKQFSTPYRLKAHGRSHTGQTFPCEENGCQKTFITPSDLNKHARTHTGDKPFFCDVEDCGKVYSTAHHLKVNHRHLFTDLIVI